MTKEQAMAKDRPITQADLRHWLKLEGEQLAIGNARTAMADDVVRRLICGAKVKPGALACRLETDYFEDGVKLALQVWEPDGD